MARPADKNKAIKLRKAGYSYTQIKELVGVGKGTLSTWLRDYPISEKRIRELRDWNQQRIENYRKTRERNRNALLKLVYDAEQKKILPLSDRDLFIGGLFLYLGEGSKTQSATVQVTNTDPAIIRAFLAWLRLLGIRRNKIVFRLHLYKDMNIKDETRFWRKNLGASRLQFKKPYIKDSSLSGLSYKNGVGHGTCNAIVWDATLWKKVMAGIQVLRNSFDRRP